MSEARLRPIVRITECRREGHLYALDGDHCMSCGAPWFFRWVQAEEATDE